MIRELLDYDPITLVGWLISFPPHKGNREPLSQKSKGVERERDGEQGLKMSH